MKNSLNKNYNISILRFISMLLIIVCHLFQYFNHSLAFVFNIGVQFFIIISAFLYGKKSQASIITEEESSSKEKKVISNFSKILIDYYIVLLISVVLNLIFSFNNLSFIGVLKQIIFINGINGLEHLWFVPFILSTYLLTPILTYLANKISKINNIIKKVFIFTGISIIITLLALGLFGYNSMWFFIYCFTFFLSHCNIIDFSIENSKNKNVAIVLLIVLIIVHSLKFIPYVDNIVYYFVNRCYTSFAIFYIYMSASKYIKYNKKIKFLDFFDKYSYDVYLVHQMFILGNLSVLSLTNHLVINIIICFLLITITTFLVIAIKNLIKYLLKKQKTIN